MEDNNNNLSNIEYIKIGSFLYNINQTPFRNISREEVVKFVKFDDNLEDLSTFFIDINSFMFYIYYNHIKGHKLILKRSSEYGHIDIYSMNYDEVMKKENIQKVKR